MSEVYLIKDHDPPGIFSPAWMIAIPLKGMSAVNSLPAPHPVLSDTQFPIPGNVNTAQICIYTPWYTTTARFSLQ